MPFHRRQKRGHEIPLVTRLDSLEKVFHWPSFKGLSLLWGHSSEASSSSTGGIWRMGRLCSEDCCWHLSPDCAAGVSGTVQVAFGVVVMPSTACSWAVVDISIRAASGMLPVSSCKGYMKFTWASGGHICTTAQKASVKAWHSLPSSAFASHSSTIALLL